MNPIDLTQLLVAVIALTAAVAARYLIPYLKEQFGIAKIKRLYEWARIAVKAAEQLYGDGKGKEKLQYALKVLRENGFDIDTPAVRDAIEAAVYTCTNFIE